MFIHESINLLRLFWPLQYPKLTFCPVSPRFVLSSKNSLKLHVSVKPASHTHRLPSRHWYFLPHQIKQIWLVYLCPWSMTGRVGCLHRRRPLTPFYMGRSPPWWRDGGFQLIGKWPSDRHKVCSKCRCQGFCFVLLAKVHRQRVWYEQKWGVNSNPHALHPDKPLAGSGRSRSHWTACLPAGRGDLGTRRRTEGGQGEATATTTNAWEVRLWMSGGSLD